MDLPKKEQEYLLNLSRKALEKIFETGKGLVVKDSDIPENLRQNRATFVTLTINGKLRGCIGKIYPVQEIYKDVVENTYSAAFDDPRFAQLTKEEFKKVKIEISILDKPKLLKYKNPDNLITKLRKEKPGVILRQNLYSATFLPQVWDELKTPQEFLSHLCLKAGLGINDWQKGNLEIETYNVLKFSE
ncbi:AmmeMemoRadiSam system protein A [Candidatus Dojkabacteria bacterium]|nr:AmmeMemoRadiSam system protein A [Candidatus Dojkabacteria bacterium]